RTARNSYVCLAHRSGHGAPMRLDDFSISSARRSTQRPWCFDDAGTAASLASLPDRRAPGCPTRGARRGPDWGGGGLRQRRGVVGHNRADGSRPAHMAGHRAFGIILSGMLVLLAALVG